MTECIDGVCHMTGETQFTTMIVALFAVFLVVLGIWAIIRQIIEEDIKDATNRDIALFTEDMYLDRPLPPLRISPQGWRWLERKVRGSTDKE